jgi:hypothetical protein
VDLIVRILKSMDEDELTVGVNPMPLNGCCCKLGEFLHPSDHHLANLSGKIIVLFIEFFIIYFA